MALPEELEETYHREIGIEKGRKETARNMLKMGLDIRLICQATRLSEKEVENLREEHDLMC